MTRKSCVSTPEVKVFILLCYIFVLMGFLWISFTISVSKFEEFEYYINEYARCMAGGVRNGLDCSELENKFEHENLKYFQVANLVMHAFLNWAYLPLVLSYHSLKKLVKKFLSLHTTVRLP